MEEAGNDRGIVDDLTGRDTLIVDKYGLQELRQSGFQELIASHVSPMEEEESLM